MKFWKAGLALGTTAIVGTVASRVLRIVERPSWPPPVDAITSDQSRAAAEQLIARSPAPRDIGLDYAWSTATSIDPWPEGDQFFPRILADLEDATGSIHILMFGWKDGEIGQKFSTLLRRKLAEGVQVRILVDSFGSRPYGVSKGIFQALSDAGATIVVNDLLPPERSGLYANRKIHKPSRELGRAEHRKLYVIDGSVMWTGGAGIEDHFHNGKFHDVMVRLTGDVVRQAQAVFLTSFASHGGLLPQDLSSFFTSVARISENLDLTQDPGPPPALVPVALVQVVPGGFVSATQAARSLIRDAAQRLDIMNPYLTDPDIIDQLIVAAKRGVAVRIVLSAKSNNAMATAATKHRYSQMIESGITIWEYPDAVVHAKLIVSDNTVLFGTLNLDAWALYRDYEFAIVAKDRELVELFEARIFEPDIALCSRGNAPRNWSERGVSALADKIAFFL